MSANTAWPQPPEVIIVGAGLSGLLLGILLDRAKIPFNIYERAPHVKPLGNSSWPLKSSGHEACIVRSGVTLRTTTVPRCDHVPECEHLACAGAIGPVGGPAKALLLESRVRHFQS